jgi:hypothetical protein
MLAEIPRVTEIPSAVQLRWTVPTSVESIQGIVKSRMQRWEFLRDR